MGQLWQVPVLAVSLVAFSGAVYLLAKPPVGPSVEHRLGVARELIQYERPEAAISAVKDVLERKDLTGEERGRSHLILAEAIAAGQRQKRIDLAENHETVVGQTRKAIELGAKLGPADYRRYADSLEALGANEEALGAVQRAIQSEEKARGKGKLGPEAVATEVALRRQEIELLLKLKRPKEAEPAIEAYERLPDLSDGEKAWAMGARAELLVAKRQFEAARALLQQVLDLKLDDATRGETAYRYGLCAVELGDKEEAERQFRLARNLLKVRHPLDAEAAYRLGLIYEERDKPDEAISFYQVVMTSHPDSPAMLPSRLGRGVCRLMKGADEAGLADLEDVVRQLERPAYRKTFEKLTVTALQKGSALLANRQNYQGALELLALEHSLVGKPDAGFWGRVALVYGRRSDQVEAAAYAQEDAGDRERMLATSRELRVRAGDAYVSQSKALTVIDNAGHGVALWRAVESYDRAGATRSVISTLELFTRERPSDTQAPEAQLRLGLAYMAAGDFEQAAKAFEHNRVRYAKSLAASKSAVPLAQALIARGAEYFPRAEAVLREMLETDRSVTPEADEFRNALFELAQLYYRQGRYEDSIGRFDEIIKRYPGEKRMPQVLFLMADGYRRSAGLLGTARGGEKPAAGVGPTTRTVAEAEAARRERIGQARALFDRVVAGSRERPPSGDVERSQLRLAHFYRADCAYDLGMYEEAIKLYDQAAFRYQDDASSLAALVQIVNANVAMGKLPEARSANERAKWLLKRMPEGAFAEGKAALSRENWEQWLKWSGEAGGSGEAREDGAGGQATAR